MMLERDELIVSTAMLAGKILMESGAETARVEDTMERMIRGATEDPAAKSYYTYVTLNGLFVRLNGMTTTFLRIDTRDYDLSKVSQVNALSRAFVNGDRTLEEAYAALQGIDAAKLALSPWKRYIFAALLSVSIALIFGGSWVEIPGALVAGLATYMIYTFVSQRIDMPFLLEFLSTLCGGLLGLGVVRLTGANLSTILIGAMIPLVPGIAITNSFRDLVERHYLSGMLRLVESLLIAAALGSGAALVAILNHMV